MPKRSGTEAYASPEYLAFKAAGCDTVADKRRWDAARAWQREQDCKIIDMIDDGEAPEYRACQEAIRAAANTDQGERQ